MDELERFAIVLIDICLVDIAVNKNILELGNL